MSTYSLNLLDTLNPGWRELPVSLVAFPCPPAPVGGLFFSIDSWKSDTLERAGDFFPGHVVGRFSERGPAFLMKWKLGELLTDQHDYFHQHYFGVHGAVYCAGVTYQTFVQDGELQYVNHAVIESAMLVRESCNPASHMVAPGAPQLTMMLLLDRGYEQEDAGDFVFADGADGAALFPGYDWSGNAALDHLFKYLTISQAMGKPVTGTNWPRPERLSQAVQTHLSTTLASNERLSRLYPDPLKLMAVIDRRDHNLLKSTGG